MTNLALQITQTKWITTACTIKSMNLKKKKDLKKLNLWKRIRELRHFKKKSNLVRYSYIKNLQLFEVTKLIAQAEQQEQDLKKRITDQTLQEKENKKTVIQVKDAVKSARSDNDLFEQFVKNEVAKLKQEEYVFLLPVFFTTFQRVKLESAFNDALKQAEFAKSQWENHSLFKELQRIQEQVSKLSLENTEKQGQLQVPQWKKDVIEFEQQLQTLKAKVEEKRIELVKLEEDVKIKDDAISGLPTSLKRSAGEAGIGRDDEDNEAQQGQKELEEVENNHKERIRSLQEKIVAVNMSLRDQESLEAEVLEQVNALKQLHANLQEQQTAKLCGGCILTTK